VTAAQRPVFSVVIPTRNRSAVLVTALNSVVAQRFSGFEIIVVNDGSSSEHETPYRMALGAAPQARMVNLRRTKRDRATGAMPARPKQRAIISAFSTMTINGPIRSIWLALPKRSAWARRVPT
jgi:hypothetical protein